ncbi:hypothetical protein DB346_08495 [Verrucomicrobia bacterium LW23]|nr:hypothetical protein DB346_08495 [Verrucomicrobia bacterium LW23]
MAWITITPADVDMAKAGPQVEALRTAALAEDQPDPITGAIERTILKIRQKILSCPTNRVDVDASLIPPELADVALRMVYRELQQRLNVSLTALPLTDDDRKQWDVDVRTLDAIAACKLVVTLPDNPVEGGVQTTGSIRVVSSSPRLTGRDRLKGLL